VIVPQQSTRQQGGEQSSSSTLAPAKKIWASKERIIRSNQAGWTPEVLSTNPIYDALLDDLAPRSSDDPHFQADAVKALEIYWKDQIDIPVIEWLHRIPYNQTYWINWPTKANPAGGTNAAFWAHTGMLVITQLKAVQ